MDKSPVAREGTMSVALRVRKTCLVSRVSSRLKYRNKAGGK